LNGNFPNLLYGRLATTFNGLGKKTESIVCDNGYKNLITISDQIKMIDDRFFYLLGRNSDLVKIGGKRESLSGLSYKLKKIDGVDDGIFFIPKEDTNKRVFPNLLYGRLATTFNGLGKKTGSIICDNSCIIYQNDNI
jgi:acyl-CoA synthetase (AMP-forming)/AMP-acid ligase II